MKLKDVIAKIINGLFGGKKDAEAPAESEIISTTIIIDEQLPKEMIEELSNGKGEDE